MLSVSLPNTVSLIDGQAFLNTIDAAKLCGLSIAEFHRRVKDQSELFKPIVLGRKCTRFKVSNLVAAMDTLAVIGGAK